MSQDNQILNYLKSGNSLTPLEALEKFKTMRLAARIDDLKRQGFVIETEIVRNNGKRYARYYIPQVPEQLDLAI